MELRKQAEQQNGGARTQHIRTSILEHQVSLYSLAKYAYGSGSGAEHVVADFITYSLSHLYIYWAHSRRWTIAL
jgi:hypothetical protein